ncbi:hypothetical protein CUB86_26880 [Pseudomonas syringae pv. actinidiae]|uniref:Uncharacterized protein n=1 Tax=Pseudomonas syringae pv. actinidiae TaxID=103796 RepID=A0AAU8XCP0_PSESF|nr:hypothetical protein CT122_05045 [Pseudomonas syringae pv. actinidiae]PIN58603.1 hypothetical protein CUB86_26880 [Pseudomonas syringae pv. actinidiae]
MSSLSLATAFKWLVSAHAGHTGSGLVREGFGRGDNLPQRMYRSFRGPCRSHGKPAPPEVKRSVARSTPARSQRNGLISSGLVYNAERLPATRASTAEPPHHSIVLALQPLPCIVALFISGAFHAHSFSLDRWRSGRHVADSDFCLRQYFLSGPSGSD